MVNRIKVGSAILGYSILDGFNDPGESFAVQVGNWGL